MGHSVARAIVLLACLLAPLRADAAIAFVNGADGGNNGGSTASLSFSITIAAGSNRLLVAHWAGDVVGGNDDCTSVTFNGTSFTGITHFGASGGNRYAYQAYLLNPDATTANLVITCSTTHYILGGATWYAGVAQSGQPDAVNTQTGGTSGVVAQVTYGTANVWDVVTAVNYNTNTASTTATPGATRRAFDGSFGSWAAFDIAASVAPPGVATISVTNAGGSTTNFAGLSVAYKPFVAAATTPNLLPLLGVGPGE